MNLRLRCFGLFCLLTSLSTRADDLKLFITSAKPSLSWKTPRSLVFTAARVIMADAHATIGHVTVELTCEGSDGLPPERVFSGATNANDEEETDLVYKKKAGLGVLLYDYKGHLETPEEVIYQNTIKFPPTGLLRIAKFLVRPSTCRRLAQYYREYAAAGYGEHYGLPNRPRYREGAGCSAFAVSFLEIAGLLATDYRNAWIRNIRIPARLLGHPFRDRNVTFMSLFSSKSRRWAHENEEHELVSFYDPSLMTEWVDKLWDLDASRWTPDFARDPELAQTYNAKAIVFDRRFVPTPMGSFWLR